MNGIKGDFDSMIPCLCIVMYYVSINDILFL